MINRHNPHTSTAVPAWKLFKGPVTKSEGSFNELGAAPNAGARERAMQLSGTLVGERFDIGAAKNAGLTPCIARRESVQ